MLGNSWLSGLLGLFDAGHEVAEERKREGSGAAIIRLLSMVLGHGLMLLGAFGVCFGIFWVQDGNVTTGTVLLGGSLIAMIIGVLLVREK